MYNNWAPRSIPVQQIQESKEERKKRLDREWHEKLPCHNCQINEVCKHADSFHRPDYNTNIFAVTIVCDTKNLYTKAFPNEMELVNIINQSRIEDPFQ